MNTMDELVSLSKVPFDSLIWDYKKKGKKVIGFFCSYVPEEVIYASGMLPIRLRPTECQETMTADAFMSRLNCTFARSCLEMMLKGSFDLLDGIVFANTCDNIRRLYDLSREIHSYPFMHFMSIPHKAGSPGALNWYKEEILHLKEKIEGHFGIRISPDSLIHAIGVYNEARALLKNFYAIRQGIYPPITGSESLSILLSTTTSPKDQSNPLLRKLLEELQGKNGQSGYRARLMIVGSEYDDPDFTQVMEDLGGIVVTDALCFGTRYFWEPVKIEGDVFESLARSYLNRPSCPRMSDRVVERATFIKERVEEFKVDGVIFQKIRYCDLWGGESIYLEKMLKESNIPFLSIEREYRLSHVGQLKTRVQAFLERIERG